MPPATPGHSSPDDILELSELVEDAEEHSDGLDAASVDMTFEQELEELFSEDLAADDDQLAPPTEDELPDLVSSVDESESEDDAPLILDDMIADGDQDNDLLPEDVQGQTTKQDDDIPLILDDMLDGDEESDPTDDALLLDDALESDDEPLLLEEAFTQPPDAEPLSEDSDSPDHGSPAAASAPLEDDEDQLLLDDLLETDSADNQPMADETPASSGSDEPADDVDLLLDEVLLADDDTEDVPSQAAEDDLSELDLDDLLDEPGEPEEQTGSAEPSAVELSDDAVGEDEEILELDDLLLMEDDEEAPEAAAVSEAPQPAEPETPEVQAAPQSAPADAPQSDDLDMDLDFDLDSMTETGPETDTTAHAEQDSDALAELMSDLDDGLDEDLSVDLDDGSGDPLDLDAMPDTTEDAAATPEPEQLEPEQLEPEQPKAAAAQEPSEPKPAKAQPRAPSSEPPEVHPTEPITSPTPTDAVESLSADDLDVEMLLDATLDEAQEAVEDMGDTLPDPQDKTPEPAEQAPASPEAPITEPDFELSDDLSDADEVEDVESLLDGVDIDVSDLDDDLPPLDDDLDDLDGLDELDDLAALDDFDDLNVSEAASKGDSARSATEPPLNTDMAVVLTGDQRPAPTPPSVNVNNLLGEINAESRQPQTAPGPDPQLLQRFEALEQRLATIEKMIRDEVAKTVPQEAARIIREEIQALAEELGE
ncbi:hypothetical protein SAMN02745704_01681 [Paucidesulfovibrio gracilis DSM 16080]|uniref:Uncharacterized protein n=1 Tax=Paucidesulfovibrio gracilis DSM 16080 TaxID=1121449 RepID=A0A1T4X2A3_9BACT|nr:hypothetical protein [Paucidesulfovibrio gracilis]SKA83609.1 hypothetical protein SAMN02745704_01681 [Paucidesulfovibrio gracilis DSM 16080]